MPATASPSLQNPAQSLLRPLPASILVSFFTFASCYLRDFAFPNVPFALWGDQVGYFHGGSRMVLGQLPYRDYFEIVPAGTDLVYALLIRIFGLRLWIPNLTMACLAAASSLLMTLIAARLLRGPIVVLPALMLSGFILLCSVDATHHWFSTVLILAALLALIDGTSWQRVAVAGVFCGLAASFTQSKGALAIAGFAVYLAFLSGKTTHRRQKLLLLCAAAAVAFVAVNGYFVWTTGLRQWLWCVVVYPLRYYGAPSLNNWRVIFADLPTQRGGATWISYPFVFATVPWVSMTVLLLALRRRKHEAEEPWDNLLLLAVVAFATFLAVASAPALKRLAIVSPPSLILLAWLLQRPRKLAAALQILMGGAALVLAIAEPLHLQHKATARLDLPAGRAAFLNADLGSEYQWMLGHTHPGQYYFGESAFYPGLHLLDPAPIEGIDASSYSRPEQIAALVHSLDEHRVPMLLLFQTQIYLWPKRSASDPLDPLRACVRDHYERVRTFPSGDEAWVRRVP